MTENQLHQQKCTSRNSNNSVFDEPVSQVLQSDFLHNQQQIRYFTLYFIVARVKFVFCALSIFRRAGIRMSVKNDRNMNGS